MTRINCIPVSELSDKHLGAEYRELPRIFAQAAYAYDNGDDPSQYPDTYRLGTGHVRFFFTRLAYLRERFHQLVDEAHKRGRVVNFPEPPIELVRHLPKSWKRNWVPTEEARAINRARIADKTKLALARAKVKGTKSGLKKIGNPLPRKRGDYERKALHNPT